MKALLQRVSGASVVVKDTTVAEIGRGMLVFLGVEKEDGVNDLEYLVRKIGGLRIFGDAAEKMNLSVKDIRGEVLVVSQFTLGANCRKGNRPSFDKAEGPARAEELYLEMVRRLSGDGLRVAAGRFGAHMKVHLVNDGPVTIMLDSADVSSRRSL